MGPKDIDTMTILIYAFAGFAVFLQIMNIVWVFNGGSQVPVVPFLLWYVAVAIHGEGFFLTSMGREIGIVLLIHITLTFLASLLARKLSGRRPER